MRRPALTREQLKAAHRPRGDACVVAGAGSGKTRVLVERFVTLVTRDGADPRRTAALTFTEKAADEMRDRIVREFADADRGEDVRGLAREVRFAPISTLHSFCARLLREHAIDAGVDPGFSVLDETAATLLLEDAHAAVERRRGAAPRPEHAALRLLGDQRASRAVRVLLSKLRGDGVDLPQVGWRRGALSRADALAALRAARGTCEEAIAAAVIPPEETADLAEAFGRLPKPEALNEPTFDAARLAAAAGDDDAKTGLLPIASRGNRAKALREAREALVAAYGGVAEAVLDDVGEREVIGPLRDLLGEIEREYARRKREIGALDFTDLERETLALLDRLAARGRSPEGAPRELLVDEYQDTNPVQVAILSRLRRPARGDAVPQFSVGDPKQSIYRFRRADVEGIRREWEAVGEARRTRLSEAFRSRPGVVEFHNALFACLFAHGAGGVDHEPLVARGKFHDDVPEATPEVLVVDAGAGAGADARREAEARAIAARVRGWCDGTTRLAKKVEGDDGEVLPPRAMRYGDVAVLLRARSDVKAYERAFLEAGVPFHVGRGRGFFRTEEIADLLHLLRVVHDPGDRFAVAAWMASPAVGATDAEVLAAFTAEGRPFDAVLASPRLRPAAEAVLALRKRAATDSLERTVAAAVEASGAVATSLWQDGGVRRARNLAKAVAIARRLDGGGVRGGVRGLADYLRHVTDLRDREVDEPEAESGSAESDSVALLTVHAAKGLEWPCVVLADAGRKSGGHTGLWLAEGAEVAWRLRDPIEGETHAPGGLRALERADATLEAQESLRLLYVALTRACERVLVSMTAAGEKKKDGTPKEVYGWGSDLWSVLDVPFTPGATDASVGDVAVRVTVEAPRPALSPDLGPIARRLGAEGVLRGGAPGADEETRATARALWERARKPVETLHRTPFVVAISDLLAFAESPRKYYEERILLAGGEGGALRRGADEGDPAAGRDGGDDAGPAARTDDVRGGSDEAVDVTRAASAGALDRTALGRAVHAALERFHPTKTSIEKAVEDAVAGEFPVPQREAAGALATAMTRRFLDSATGKATAAALAAGKDVRREVAFHARIRFPEGAVVAGYDSLLVKGTIDLWLPTERGPFLYDHKTNSPRGRLGSLAALREHYATQLCLYALAAERVLGQDVAGAALLLLDPAWGGVVPAVESDIDVSGPRLLETRSLCRAFAVASLEDRWPEDWRRLL